MKYETVALREVLEFWFEELTPEDWYKGGEELDNKIIDRFSALHAELAAGEYGDRRETSHDYLAEVIVLDQFSRQIYRGQAEAFAWDDMAIELAQEAVAKGFDEELGQSEKQFLYMPYMHSESKEVHAEGLPLFEKLGNEGTLKYEIIHKDIVDQFGRYPHRNKQLGRESTPEEIDYLENNQESFFAS